MQQVRRGHQSIYNAYLFDELEPPKQIVVERKGRSEKLLEKRDELIVCRYWYYMKIIRKNYPDTLTELENETFLAQITITRIVQAHHPMMKSFQETKPGVNYFKKKYPFMVW